MTLRVRDLGRLRIAALVAAAVSMTACLSLMEGESVSPEARTLPEAERAVLLGHSSWYLIYAEDIAIWSVDSVMGSGAGQRRAEVAPGRHAVVVDEWHMIGGMGGKVCYRFELEFRAGHRYRIHGLHDLTPCVVVIEDSTSDAEEGTSMQVPCEERPK
jgi:hypothetical protein